MWVCCKISPVFCQLTIITSENIHIITLSLICLMFFCPNLERSGKYADLPFLASNFNNIKKFVKTGEKLRRTCQSKGLHDGKNTIICELWLSTQNESNRWLDFVILVDFLSLTLLLCNSYIMEKHALMHPIYLECKQCCLVNESVMLCGCVRWNTEPESVCVYTK